MKLLGGLHRYVCQIIILENNLFQTNEIGLVIISSYSTGHVRYI